MVVCKPFNFFEGSLLLTLASFENLLFFMFILFLLVRRKIQIANLKKKLQDDIDEKEDEKSVE